MENCKGGFVLNISRILLRDRKDFPVLVLIEFILIHRRSGERLDSLNPKTSLLFPPKNINMCSVTLFLCVKDISASLWQFKFPFSNNFGNFLSLFIIYVFLNILKPLIMLWIFFANRLEVC